MTGTLTTGTRAYRIGRSKRKRVYKGKPRRYDRYQDKVIKKLAKNLSPEKKVFHTNTNTTVISITGDLTCVSAMAQGVDDGERIGTAQKHVRLNQRIEFANSSAAPQYIRLIYFLWKDDSDTPATADVLSPPDSNILSVRTMQPNPPPYKILYDETFYLGASGGADGNPAVIIPEITFDLRKYPMAKYRGSTNTPGDLAAGHLYSLMIASAPDAIYFQQDSNYFYTDS